MEQQKATAQENFLSKVYKNFFVRNNEDKKSTGNNLKLNNNAFGSSDKIFGVSENKILNFDSKINIFNESKENTIFNLKDNPYFSPNKDSDSLGEQKAENIYNNMLDPEILNNFNLIKGELSDDLGTNLDQIC